MVARGDSKELIDRDPAESAEARGPERIDAILARWWRETDLEVASPGRRFSGSRSYRVVGPARIAR